MVKTAKAVPHGLANSGRREAGFAMVLALLVLLILSSILAVLAGGLTVQNRQLIRDARRLRADALTDAVLAETMAGLAASRTFGGVAGHELGSGFVSSNVERRGRHAVVLLEVDLGPVSRRVVVQLELTGKRPRVLSWRPARTRTAGEAD